MERLTILAAHNRFDAYVQDNYALIEAFNGLTFSPLAVLKSSPTQYNLVFNDWLLTEQIEVV